MRQRVLRAEVALRPREAQASGGGVESLHRGVCEHGSEKAGREGDVLERSATWIVVGATVRPPERERGLEPGTLERCFDRALGRSGRRHERAEEGRDERRKRK